MPEWIADRRLYLTEDNKVTADPSLGRWLLAPLGGRLTDDDCRRHGLGPYEKKDLHPHPNLPPQAGEGTLEEPGPQAGEGTPEDEGPEMRGVGVRMPRRSRRP